MADERPKNVIVDPPGEPPRWGTGTGASLPMDDEIRAARDWPSDRQQELFFKLARHLFDHRTRVPEQDRFDTSDDEQWMDNLATWFGWSDQLRDEEKARAARDSFQISDFEIQDALAADEE